MTARERKRRQVAAMMIRLRQLRGQRSQAKPHQLRVVEKLGGKQPRLLAFHEVGSGKTLTSLLAAEQATKPRGAKALFITPAGLTKNIERERKKHQIQLPRRKVQTVSYEKAVRRIDDLTQSPTAALIVADEAHRLRNLQTQRAQKLTPLLKSSEKLLMLSGSPLYNRPTDLSALVNILAKKPVLPERMPDFARAHIGEKITYPSWKHKYLFGVEPTRTQYLKDRPYLQRVLRRYVDYHEPGVTEKKQYPDVVESVIRVPLPQEQQHLYKYVEQQTLPRALRNRIRLNLPPDKKTMADLNVFASGVRQVSNTTRPFSAKAELEQSAKIDRAVSNLVARAQKDKNFRAVVYSNYLDAGINPYREQLEAKKIPHAVITGKLSAKQREDVVRRYNKGELKALLVSSAGGEGFDLKGTRLIQILDPHWNEEKINQVIGRGVRYKSHAHLPKKQRKVEVEHYLSTISPDVKDRLLRIKPTSFDEYLFNLSKSKGHIHHQLRELIRGR
jgi:SNF2 family DNA or RNA helicase